MAPAQTQRKVMSLPLAPNFHASHWQNREACQTTWHALETFFGSGDSFLHTLQAWQSDANAPDTLFFTAFSEHTPDPIHPLIADPCFGLLSGVHRMVFEQGRVQLTLCIGPLPAIAREIDIAADSIFIDQIGAWDARTVARLCKLGTAITWANHQPQVVDFKALTRTGIQINHVTSSGVYQPTWTPKTSLRPSKTYPSGQLQKKVSPHAVVIGSGLSGAAVAYSLATRGWTVEVLDQGATLGAGASGLPAGIFATHVSPDNNVLSRITRDGVRATLNRASQLMPQGECWQISNLLEHRYAGKRQLPTGSLWPAAGHEWSTEADEAQKLVGGLKTNSDALWHPLAGWIQTPAFVKAQLSHPHISWRGNCHVTKLQKTNGLWHALDEQGQCIAQSQHVVLANAHQCQTLLDTVEASPENQHLKRPHLPATALRGQVTWGSMSNLPLNLQAKLPPFPVNGHGSYIGNLKPLQNESSENCWIVGSSFQRNDFDLTTRQADLQSNIQQWSELMPALQNDILQGIDQAHTHSWAAIRSALPDRVPAVGSFEHPDFTGLQVCTGMGARGISWSVLCGELLASHLNHEPLPMAASLAKLIAASRFG